jgi:hypothetical protein
MGRVVAIRLSSLCPERDHDPPGVARVKLRGMQRIPGRNPKRVRAFGCQLPQYGHGWSGLPWAGALLPVRTAEKDRCKKSRVLERNYRESVGRRNPQQDRRTMITAWPDA